MFKSITEIIQSMKITAAGCDGIDIGMSRLCSPYAIPCITHIISSCILEKVCSRHWKGAVIIPALKQCDICEPNDLRLINLLPLLPKVLERILEKQIANKSSTSFFPMFIRASGLTLAVLLHCSMSPVTY
ncbi:hypothetical protein Trydic_g12359 [Trypoxylus dichotomus]